MKKNLLLLIILIVGGTPLVSITAQKPSGSYWESVDEILDLYVDGSINPVLVNITKDYDYISLIAIHLGFSQISIDFDDFGEGNGTNALANGTQLYRNGTAQFIPVKSNDDLMGISRWTDIWEDDAGSTGVHIHVVIDYTQLIPNLGLAITDSMFSPYLMFKVQDNIPDFCDEFYVIVSGRIWINVASPKATSFDITNPFQLFQDAFNWVLSNFWIPVLGILSFGILIFIIRKM